MTLVLPEKRQAVAADLRRLVGAGMVRDDRMTPTAYAAQGGEAVR